MKINNFLWQLMLLKRKILPKHNDDYDMKKDPSEKELDNELATLILIVILMLKLKEKALICSKIK